MIPFHLFIQPRIFSGRIELKDELIMWPVALKTVPRHCVFVWARRRVPRTRGTATWCHRDVPSRSHDCMDRVQHESNHICALVNTPKRREQTARDTVSGFGHYGSALLNALVCTKGSAKRTQHFEISYAELALNSAISFNKCKVQLLNIQETL